LNWEGGDPGRRHKQLVGGKRSAQVRKKKQGGCCPRQAKVRTQKKNPPIHGGCFLTETKPRKIGLPK